MFSVNQLILVKKGLHRFCYHTLCNREVFIHLKYAPFLKVSERLITILICLFPSFNGFILKQIMKRTKCTSTQILIMCFSYFLRKKSTLACLCVYQDATSCRLFLCSKIQTRVPLLNQHDCQNVITSIYLVYMFVNDV